MNIERLRNYIETCFENKEWTPLKIMILGIYLKTYSTGEIRAAQKIDGAWHTNSWVKKGILLGFRIGKMASFSQDIFTFYDKHTYPLKSIDIHEGIRLVPGGSSVRDGVYIAKAVTIMPPSYVNVGAYIDEGTMIDSHALVGSCAQIGKNVHISAASMIGGVLEPIGANPVIIEDNVFIGGNCGIYEGAIIKQGAVIAAGVIITGGTSIYDATKDRWISRESGKGLMIPENAVIVQGSKPLKANPEFHVACPIIIKYRDSKTNASIILEGVLRS